MDGPLGKSEDIIHKLADQHDNMCTHMVHM